MYNILQLNRSINFYKIKRSINNKNKNRTHKKNYEEDQEIVYKILHEFSNYDEVIWSLYKNSDSKFIHEQLQLILVEISKLDPSLTWACMKIIKRYKNQFNQRKLRNSFVKTTSLRIGQS